MTESTSPSSSNQLRELYEKIDAAEPQSTATRLGAFARGYREAEAFLLSQQEVQHTELAPAPRDEELRREESVELVSAMVAGAGFELLRDAPGETAMWRQALPSRPNVQVFVTVEHHDLVELSPAELFSKVKAQVGS